MSRAKGGRRSGGGPSPILPAAGATRVGLLLLRLWTGGVFLVTAEWKLNQPGLDLGGAVDRFRTQELLPLVQRAIAHPPEVFGQPLLVFADLLRGIEAAAGFWAPAILAFEAVLGATLVLGFGVRLFGALGFLMMLAFTLAKAPGGWQPGDPVGVYLFTVRSANWPLTLALLLLALAAAGRVLGLDRWVRRRAPAWLRWIG